MIPRSVWFGEDEPALSPLAGGGVAAVSGLRANPVIRRQENLLRLKIIVDSDVVVLEMPPEQVGHSPAHATVYFYWRWQVNEMEICKAVQEETGLRGEVDGSDLRLLLLPPPDAREDATEESISEWLHRR